MGAGRAGMWVQGGPCVRSRGGMTGMHVSWLQSEPLNPESGVAAAGKQEPGFIISRRGRGASSRYNSILGLLRKKGGRACWVHVDARCFRSGPGLGQLLGEGRGGSEAFASLPAGRDLSQSFL